MLGQKVAFIGSGAMGEAMISSLLRGKLSEPQALYASSPRRERVDDLQKKYGIHPFTDNREAVTGADVVVLSVKPQRLTEVLHNLKGAIQPQALVLSIVAGATIKRGEDSLP